MAEGEAVVAVFSEAAAAAMAEHRSLAGEHVEAGTARAEEGAEAGAAAEQQVSNSTGVLGAAGLRQDTRYSGCSELQEADRMQAGQRQGKEQNSSRMIVLELAARGRKQGSTQ